MWAVLARFVIRTPWQFFKIIISDKSLENWYFCLDCFWGLAHLFWKSGEKVLAAIVSWILRNLKSGLPWMRSHRTSHGGRWAIKLLAAILRSSSGSTLALCCHAKSASLKSPSSSIRSMAWTSHLCGHRNTSTLFQRHDDHIRILHRHGVVHTVRKQT